MNQSNFNDNISNWNVSNVTDMNNIFYSATKFNQPLNIWNVGKVTDMGSMFENAKFIFISFKKNIMFI